MSASHLTPDQGGEAAGPAPDGSLPALRRAEASLASRGRGFARRAVRVPAGAVVGLGTDGPAGKTRLVVANDNQRRLTAGTRRILRELFFVVVFGATLAGTYYIGRVHAFHNVIVVPDTQTRTQRIV